LIPINLSNLQKLVEVNSFLNIASLFNLNNHNYRPT